MKIISSSSVSSSSVFSSLFHSPSFSANVYLPLSRLCARFSKRVLQLAAVAALTLNVAHAATQANQYFIKVDITGSHIPLKLIKSNIPFNKSYSSFNDVDKATYRSYYENIPAENIPPFPVNGLGQIAKDVKDAHSKMQKTGGLFVVAKVDEAGEIEKVSVFDSPDERMTQLVSAAIWEETFVAGTCAGKPCPMEFVLDWQLLPVRGSAVVDSDKKSRSSRKRSD